MRGVYTRGLPLSSLRQAGQERYLSKCTFPFPDFAGFPIPRWTFPDFISIIMRRHMLAEPMRDVEQLMPVLRFTRKSQRRRTEKCLALG